MKKKNIIKKYFIIVSATFICGLIFAYGTRLIHFYLKENRVVEDDEVVVKTNYFNDILENTINVTDSNGGLYLDKESYIYKYDATDNYLWYSGQMWRILKINDDKTITMITDEAIALMQIKYEDNIFIEDYLNDFYEKLDHDYLVPFTVCADKIVDNKITCEDTKEVNIALLDLFTYNKCGSLKSFINDNTTFWLNSRNDEDNFLYINSEGAVGVGSEIAHNIRPVVTIKDKIDLVDGDGTKENPYIISKKGPEKISESFVGEYITYNDSIWRIINITEKSVQAIKTTCIKTDNDECLNYKFGTIINYYNSLLYKYLNNTYLKNLENSDYIVKDNFYNGVYADYNYKALNDSTVEAYVGLPKITEYYIQNNINSYLITPNLIETVYTINEMGNYYLVKPTNELNIYPVLNFDVELSVIDGEGTINSPYELSR